MNSAMTTSSTLAPHPIRGGAEGEAEDLDAELNADGQRHHTLDLRAGHPIQQRIPGRLREGAEGAADDRPADQQLVADDAVAGKQTRHGQRRRHHAELQHDQESVADPPDRRPDHPRE